METGIYHREVIKSRPKMKCRGYQLGYGLLLAGPGLLIYLKVNAAYRNQESFSRVERWTSMFRSNAACFDLTPIPRCDALTEGFCILF